MIKTRSTRLFDLSPNAAMAPEIRVEPRGWPVPGEDVTGPVAANETLHVAFCQDQLGNSYRFVPFHVAADVWRPADPRPAWLVWYEERRKDVEKSEAV
jgi:hypothetical protein